MKSETTVELISCCKNTYACFGRASGVSAGARRLWDRSEPWAQSSGRSFSFPETFFLRGGTQAQNNNNSPQLEERKREKWSSFWSYYSLNCERKSRGNNYWQRALSPKGWTTIILFYWIFCPLFLFLPLVFIPISQSCWKLVFWRTLWLLDHTQEDGAQQHCCGGSCATFDVCKFSEIASPCNSATVLSIMHLPQ